MVQWNRWAALALATIAAGIWADGLAAQGLASDDESGYPSGEISITATRIPESPSAVPPAVSIITSDEIEARGAKTAADAIKVVPGVAISDTGPDGGQKAVSIRGSTTNEVLVLVDGVRANNAMSGLADLSNIPVDNIDHIEVVRDGGSALYGGDAVGGVINIITKKKAAPLVLSFENGGYLPAAHVTGFGFAKTAQPADAASLVDGQKAAFSWSPKLGDVLFRSSGSFTRADNEYTFIDANGDNRQLQNAALIGGDGSFGFTLPCLDGSLATDFAGSYGTNGTPGTQSTPTLHAAETDSSARATVKYSADRFLADSLNLDATLHAEYTGIDYMDADTPANDSTQKVYVGGLDLQQTALISAPLSLVYGTSLAYNTVSSDTVGSPERFSAGAFFEPVFEIGAFSFRPALRYDYYSDFFANDPLGGIGATIAAAWRISPTDVLKLNISRTYRVPTFEDLYWPASNGVAGNPNLKPETAYAVDLGFERSRGSFTYSAIAYARYAEDVILWQPGSDGIWRPSNYGAGLYPGIEQELRTNFSDHYWVSLNYSFLYSYLLDTGMTLADDLRIPMTPVHSLNAILGYDDGPFSWSVTAKYSSLRFLTTGNVGYLPAWFTLDAIAKWKCSTHFAAYIAVDNIFDEQYEILDDYPMPGTRVRLGVELRL
jgi:outer membrane cobalamin receptor